MSPEGRWHASRSAVRRPGLPYTSVIVRDVALLCFPPDDAVFSAYVRRTFESLTEDVPVELQRELRTLYPRAVARSREPLASLAGKAWYVYRDGRYSPFVDGPPWWDEPTAARVVIDDAGCYVDANPPALELLGVSLDELRRSKAGDFTPPTFGRRSPGSFSCCATPASSTAPRSCVRMATDRTRRSSSTSSRTAPGRAVTCRRCAQCRPRHPGSSARVPRSLLELEQREPELGAAVSVAASPRCGRPSRPTRRAHTNRPMPAPPADRRGARATGRTARTADRSPRPGSPGRRRARTMHLALAGLGRGS